MNRSWFQVSITVAVCILGSMLALVPPTSVSSGNFPIGVYHDPVTIHHVWNEPIDSILARKYFAEMDTFGVDYIIDGITIPLVFMAYDSFGIKIYPSNRRGANDSRIWVTDTFPNKLEAFMFNGRRFEMEIEGLDHYEMGYYYSNDLATGADFGTYRKAERGGDNPGYLFRKVYEPYSAAVGGNLRYEKLNPVDFRGWDTLIIGTDSLIFNDSAFLHRGFFGMKYSNPDPNCSDTCVIGQIRIQTNFSDTNASDMLTIYNDTLIYDIYGDTLRIDDPSLIWAGYWEGYPNDTLRPDSVTYGYVKRIVMLEPPLGLDTISWGRPLWSIKDIKPCHFSGINQWDTISALYCHRLPRMTFWWTGKATIDIDNFFYSNRNSFLFRNMLNRQDMAAGIDAVFNDLELGGNAYDACPKWQPYDEPWPGNYYPMKHFAEVINKAASYGGSDTVSILTARGESAESNGIPIISSIVSKNYFPDYLCEIMTYRPAVMGPLSSTDMNDPENVQMGVDSFICMVSAHARRADSAMMNFVPIIYPGGAYRYDAITNCV